MLWPVILDTDSQLLVAQVDAGDEVPVVVKHSDLCLRLRQTGIDQHQSGPRLLWGFRTPVDQRQHRTEADQAARTGMFGNDGLHVGDLDIGRILDGTVVTTRVDGMPHRVLRTELVEKLESGSRARGFAAALRNAGKFRRMSQMTWRSMIRDGLTMRHGKELTWSQVLMAANTPMLLKAGLVDGNTEAGVLASGQVAGILDDLPSCKELIESIVLDAITHLQTASALVE